MCSMPSAVKINITFKFIFIVHLFWALHNNFFLVSKMVLSLDTENRIDKEIKLVVKNTQFHK